jgi:hypothetical protein
MICKLFSPPFYLFENTFDGIPISMGDVLKSEVFLEQRGL